MSDERLKKSADNRQSREMADRAVVENRALSDEDRVRMFRMKSFQSALPDLPKIPGWHLCWLTTTNHQDSIHERMRLGYVPVKPEDVAGWDHSTMKSGEFSGCISINEMLAYKLPMNLYEHYMNVNHHEIPREQEQAIYESALSMQEEAQRHSAKLEIGDGISDLGKNRKALFDLA
jgi:hypothetical protein